MPIPITVPSLTAAADPEDLPPSSMDPTNEVPPAEHHQPMHPPSEAPSARAVLGELKVSSVTPNSVDLQWSIPEGPFDSFMLQYRDAQGQPQALPIDGRSHSVTVLGLSPSHQYRFHLYGMHGQKRIDHVSIDISTATDKPEEPPSPSKEPKTEAPQTKDNQPEHPQTAVPPARSVLRELRVSTVSPDSVGLQWSVPEDSFDSFMLQYWDAHGKPQALPIDGRSRSVMVLGLSPSHQYHFHLYGLRDGRRTNHVSTNIATAKPEDIPLPSEPKTEATPSDALPARAMLGELKVSSVTPDSVQLQWSVPESPFSSFMLQYRDAQGQPQALPIDGMSRSVTVP
ncbi:TENX protein, partial [Pardalotus punctatus]|nr:TENX protein [Pardalotus punctatus]